MSAQVFDALKRCLRAKGMSYRELADRLGVSEPTIKRLFHEKDCKIGRLEEICSAIGVEIESIFMSANKGPGKGGRIPASAVARLAENASLFGVLILLSQNFSADYIMRVTGLTPASLFLYFRDLERLGLVVRGAGLSVKLTIDTPIEWDLDGPLHAPFRAINLEFVQWVLDRVRKPTDEAAFISFSRRMRAETAERLRVEVEALFERAKVLAWHDQHTTPEDDLVEFKWALAIGRTPHDILGILPHPEERRAPGEVGQGDASSASKRGSLVRADR